MEVRKERKEKEERTLGDGESGRPLFPEDVEADRAVRVDTVGSAVSGAGRLADSRSRLRVGEERNGEEGREWEGEERGRSGERTWGGRSWW